MLTCPIVHKLHPFTLLDHFFKIPLSSNYTKTLARKSLKCKNLLQGNLKIRREIHSLLHIFSNSTFRYKKEIFSVYLKKSKLLSRLRDVSQYFPYT